jgi:hypothetical protein
MRDIFKVISILVVSVIGILVILFFIFVIGFTTDVSNEKIDESKLLKCQEVVNIIDRNKNHINQSILNKAVARTCIRYNIDSAKDVDSLFSSISDQEKNRLIELVNSKFCERIHIGETTECIMFLLETSKHDASWIGEYKKFFIIYEKKPNCNCKDNPIGDPDYPDYVEQIKGNWYKVKVAISLRHFGC